MVVVKRSHDIRKNESEYEKLKEEQERDYFRTNVGDEVGAVQNENFWTALHQILNPHAQAFGQSFANSERYVFILPIPSSC